MCVKDFPVLLLLYLLRLFLRCPIFFLLLKCSCFFWVQHFGLFCQSVVFHCLNVDLTVISSVSCVSVGIYLGWCSFMVYLLTRKVFSWSVLYGFMSGGISCIVFFVPSLISMAYGMTGCTINLCIRTFLSIDKYSFLKQPITPSLYMFGSVPMNHVYF